MNWLKDKKQRFLVGIGIALWLCGFLLILLSRKVDGYPHNICTDLGILIGMISGGLVGFVLFFPLFNHSRFNARGNENQLKKKAWKDFWATWIITVVALLMFGFLTYANISGAMGARCLIFGLLYGGLCAGVVIFCRWNNNSSSIFDERELQLIQHAANISNGVFMVYVFLALMAAFYLIGGRGMVPMWSIPLALFCGIFMAGTVQSFILLHYAKEDDKNIEGSAV